MSATVGVNNIPATTTQAAVAAPTPATTTAPNATTAAANTETAPPAAAAAAVTTTATNTKPSVAPRFKTGEDVDPLKEERTGLIREVGCQAIWSLSSCKPGFGVDQLRDPSLDTYWQSDGQLPHLVNVQFRRKTTIRDICVYTDFKLDESYTPSKISIRCGTHFNDLQEVEVIDFSEPSGWVQIYLKDMRDRPIRTFMLQLAVLSNHQNGRDTHLRQIRIHSPVENLPVTAFAGQYSTTNFDVSIWLHQVVKGFRDKDGNPLPNAHLLGVFYRVCKILSYGIKPIFVYDGGVPSLKKQTISHRKQRKYEATNKASIARTKLLSNYLKQQVQRDVRQQLPPTRQLESKIIKLASKTSPFKGSSTSTATSDQDQEQIISTTTSATKSSDISKKGSKSPRKKKDQVEKLFEEDFEKFREKIAGNIFSVFLPEKLNQSDDESDSNEAFGDIERKLDLESSNSSAEGDEYREYYGRNYVDSFPIIESKEFDTLPLEEQHEILFEMQESRKMNSWGKIGTLPKEPQSFSSYQMDLLLKRKKLQSKIKTVQKEMGERHIHLQNFEDLDKFNYGKDDDEVQILDVKDNNKEKEIFGSKERGLVLIRTKEEKPSTSKGINTNTNSKINSEVITIEDEYEHEVSSIKNLEEDQDIQMAIQMSLSESRDKVAKIELDENEKKVVNTDTDTGSKSKDKYRKSHFEDEDIQLAIQMSLQMADKVEESKIEIKTAEITSIPNESLMSDTSPESPEPFSRSLEKIEKFVVTKMPDIEGTITSTSTSDDDDDFEEVEEQKPVEIVLDNLKIDKISPSKNDLLTIEFDKNEILPIEQDIFADIFESNSQTSEISDLGLVPPVSVAVPEPVAENLDKIVDNETIEIDKSDDFIEDVVVVENDTIEDIVVDTDTIEEIQQPLRMLSNEFMQNQAFLNEERDNLKQIRGNQERIATTINEQMAIESQELLTLFGVPFITSPMEAESQCSFLDRSCMTDGTITDDSDVWLFGGQRVFKDFFNPGKRPIEFYEYSSIVSKLNLDREKLILFALLTGCDYTEGIQGVGPVTALEIISEFSSNTSNPFEILENFGDWWKSAQIKRDKSIDAENKIREKLRKLTLPSGFPNRVVFDAFIEPKVDESTEPFRWGTIDFEGLKKYTLLRFGWDESKCNSALLPVLKSKEDSNRKQLTLHSYFSTTTTTSNLPNSDNKRKGKSKRMTRAVKKLKRGAVKELNLSESDSESSESDEDKKLKPKSKSVFPKKMLTKPKNALKIPKLTMMMEDPVNVPGTSTSTGPKPSQSQSTAISTTTKKPPVIHQRLQNELLQKERKMKAIEILKKSSK